MQNDIQIITPDSFDFKAYMAETEPLIKVLSADAWRQALVRSVREGEQILGAKLPWSKTHDHLRFRGGEVTLWQGINGHGKSQLLGQAAMWFAAQGERVCVASFEMRPLSTLKRMLRQFAMNGTPGEGAVNQLMDWAQDKFWLYDQLGSVTPDMVYAVIRYCAKELNIKHFIIDSLMKCVKGEDDYNGQKDFVDVLTGLARDLNIHIHVVHHVRKSDSEDSVPGKFDSKGSGAITDQVDQILTVWRNKKKEKAVEKLLRNGDSVPEDISGKPDAMLVCDKNRHGEWEGSVALWFHPQSLQYTPDSRNMPLDIRKAAV
ncbi:AAA family ATPase [Alcaligenes endophyticus]|uniref:AAA family ATPase n=1 Tax=Alcaligenes endophyticus TaxID=1929088 RepID=A0ABT8EIX3_9BURK|nr:DnaB-like helicase C-terminal domain-containing protein [Alcaligenes endophyticus]MCX5592513.1 AAA family ATPase [Alcaligenes endophyticus]MDN4121239.1 AAA family ATPase [Alcaligenes endophyticus]